MDTIPDIVSEYASLLILVAIAQNVFGIKHLPRLDYAITSVAYKSYARMRADISQTTYQPSAVMATFLTTKVLI